MKQMKFGALLIALVLTVSLGVFSLSAGAVDTECQHIDEDAEVNLCDLCKQFIGEGTLSLGDNQVSVVKDQFTYMLFVPETSGAYIISSTAESDPKVTVYNSNYETIASGDDEKGDLDFLVKVDMVSGNSYYLGFGDWEDTQGYTVTLEYHEHDESEQTCQGYYCETCHSYYGEPGDHNLSDVQTCFGYECMNCYSYFGEPGEHNLGSTQTCRGYQCQTCLDFFGEGDSHKHSFYDGECEYCGMAAEDYVCEHGDGEDNQVNLCDYCHIYLGDASVSLGENHLSLLADVYTYIKFVPEKTGWYIFSSESEGLTPYIMLLNSDRGFLEDAYDNASEDNHDFILSCPLIEGETYYLSLQLDGKGGDLKLFIKEHEHAGTAQNCLGYLCDECGKYFGEKAEHTLEETPTCQGQLCTVCDQYFGEVDEENRIIISCW
jgi:hypothetical protein